MKKKEKITKLPNRVLMLSFYNALGKMTEEDFIKSSQFFSRFIDSDLELQYHELNMLNQILEDGSQEKKQEFLQNAITKCTELLNEQKCKENVDDFLLFAKDVQEHRKNTIFDGNIEFTNDVYSIVQQEFADEVAEVMDNEIEAHMDEIANGMHESGTLNDTQYAEYHTMNAVDKADLLGVELGELENQIEQMHVQDKVESLTDERIFDELKSHVRARPSRYIAYRTFLDALKNRDKKKELNKLPNEVKEHLTIEDYINYPNVFTIPLRKFKHVPDLSALESLTALYLGGNSYESVDLNSLSPSVGFVYSSTLDKVKWVKTDQFFEDILKQIPFEHIKDNFSKRAMALSKICRGVNIFPSELDSYNELPYGNEIIQLIEHPFGRNQACLEVRELLSLSLNDKVDKIKSIANGEITDPKKVLKYAELFECNLLDNVSMYSGKNDGIAIVEKEMKGRCKVKKGEFDIQL